MKRAICCAGSAIATTLIIWIAWPGNLPGPTNHVRAQVKDLENPEGKVIPFGKDGIEVLAHGPVHEAFAQPGTGKLTADTVVRKQPPEPLPELPPEQKPEGAHVTWIPGYWGWGDERGDFLWVSGAWRAVPPGREWVPGYWTEENASWRWVSGYWGTQGETAVELLPEPPEPIAEAPPPQEADATYVPGTWVYRERRFMWRSGFWLTYRPGWTWCPATYVWTPGGYLFVDGYWDYDWHRRGLLFAPVYIGPRYYSGWYYRPRYAVEVDLFLGALFVRSAWNHYYFGDYYDPRYARLGFSPWIDFRMGGQWYDPAWSYYRWRYRTDPRWEQNLRQTYVTRRQNESARPPRTLAEQDRRVGGVTATAPALVRPLDKFQTASVKLQPISTAEAQQVRKTSLQVRTLGQERAKVEIQAKAKVQPGQAPTAVKVELPKHGVAAAPRTGDHVAPPSPPLPKLQPKAPPPPKKPAGAKPDLDDRHPPKVDKNPAIIPEPKPKPAPPPSTKKDKGDDPAPNPKKGDNPPGKTKKDKGADPPSARAGGDEWLVPQRSALILTRSTLGERGAFSPEDPPRFRFPARRC